MQGNSEDRAGGQANPRDDLNVVIRAAEQRVVEIDEQAVRSGVACPDEREEAQRIMRAIDNLHNHFIE